MNKEKNIFYVVLLSIIQCYFVFLFVSSKTEVSREESCVGNYQNIDCLSDNPSDLDRLKFENPTIKVQSNDGYLGIE